VTLRFGTDGVRGDATRDLASPLVYALGRASARVLGTGVPFVVGRDTRESGPRIEADLCRGLTDEGAPVVRAGVLPTPAIAYIAGELDAPAAMISASHNRWSDNGIKVFAPGGRKLDDGTEEAIEGVLHALLDRPGPAVPTPGTETARAEAGGSYVAHLVRTLDGRTLEGTRVALDCANGAASDVARSLMNAVGADTILLHAEPDGRNINEACGSTHPEALRRTVIERGCAAGLALDGDADRVIAVDENGDLVDGDQIMLMAALDLYARGALRNDKIAITVMSNLGLRHALSDAGIGVVETPVGDRNVLGALAEFDLVLGGEQSGHIVFRDHASTGDGLLTGLVVLDLMRRSGRPLSALASAMTRYPQVLVNVRVDHRPVLDDAPGLQAAVEAAQRRLGDDGRVLVRASGTEPVVRVMVEAATAEAAQREVDALVAAVEQAFSGPTSETGTEARHP
jgi:phosphoglucosamine mutase